MNFILRKTILIAALSTIATYSVYGQGTFQNLNFEQANVPSIPFGEYGFDVTAEDGIPSWTAYIGGNPATTILHNNMNLGSAGIAILGPQWYAPEILQGNYTVLLQPSSAGPSTSVAIAQSGQVPEDAQSVQFYGNGGYTLTFAGQQIPLTTLGSTSTYRIIGGDISAYASQFGELRFQGGGLVDNIFFSNQPIPEPSMFCLFGLGALLLGWRFMRKQP